MFSGGKLQQVLMLGWKPWIGKTLSERSSEAFASLSVPPLWVKIKLLLLGFQFTTGPVCSIAEYWPPKLIQWTLATFYGHFKCSVTFSPGLRIVGFGTQDFVQSQWKRRPSWQIQKHIHSASPRNIFTLSPLSLVQWLVTYSLQSHIHSALPM